MGPDLGIILGEEWRREEADGSDPGSWNRPARPGFSAQVGPGGGRRPLGMDPRGIVYIVDDNEELQRMLGRLMDTAGLEHRSYSSAKEFLASFDPRRPSCVLLDVHMPEMSGIELQEHLSAEGFTTPVIFLTGAGDVSMATGAMRRGAVDFIEKPPRHSELLDRVQQALSKDEMNLKVRAEREDLGQRFALLTDRESQVVDLLLTGLTNKAIAGQLGVTPQAIDARRSKAMQKLKVESIAELVQVVIRAQELGCRP